MQNSAIDNPKTVSPYFDLTIITNLLCFFFSRFIRVLQSHWFIVSFSWGLCSKTNWISPCRKLAVTCQDNLVFLAFCLSGKGEMRDIYLRFPVELFHAMLSYFCTTLVVVFIILLLPFIILLTRKNMSRFLASILWN